MEHIATTSIVVPFLVFFPFLGAVVSYIIGRSNEKARDIWACILSAVVFAASLTIIGKDVAYEIPGFCGLGLTFAADCFGIVLAVLTSSIWLITTLFSREYMEAERNRNRYYFFVFLTLGATMGIFLANDLFTLFIFFEIMSFTSFVLVMHDEEAFTMRAAKTYLAVAVIGGLVTLMGLFMMYQKAGTLNMRELTAFMATQNVADYYGIGVLILFGFAAKAGLFPLHVWLPNAYTVAPAPSSALLSCLLTKTGVFGTIIVSCKIFLHDVNWGYFILILGIITMVMGAVLAVFSVNLKRTLACSSMSQIGFIVIAIGMQGLLGEHNALAAAGTILHFLNHSLFKLLLFLGAGVIFMNLRELNLNKIRGYGKDKPLLKFIFLMPILGIGGIPLWNGYISKTLIHESMVEYIAILNASGQSVAFMKCAEALFLFSGGLTLAYMTKIFVCIFLEDNPYGAPKAVRKGPYMSKLMAVILGVIAIALPVLGIFPHQTQNTLADMCAHFMNAHTPDHAVNYFAWLNLKGAVISICVGVVVYFLFIRKVLMRKDENGNVVYVDCWPEWCNIEDKIYRPLLLGVLPYIGGFFARIAGNLLDGIISVLRMLIFNDDNGRVVPPEDKYFSAYTDYEADHEMYREGFAQSLLLIGIGLTIAVIYIIV